MVNDYSEKKDIIQRTMETKVIGMCNLFGSDEEHSTAIFFFALVPEQDDLATRVRLITVRQIP
ncbi:hypothetical protein GCM10020331_058780 [Ectobacillus funiculus]